MGAKYYLYRNLHKKRFSLKHRGKVIEHPEEAILLGVSFQVSEKGRQRVIRERRKNVHAMVSAASVYGHPSDTDVAGMREVTYNPYKNETFVYADTGEPVGSHYPAVIAKNNKIYIPKINL